MRILIVGHARHGKDTVAGMITKKTGLTFKGSSEAAAELFIFDALKDKYGYDTMAVCLADRVNHRDEWYRMICDYNTPDKARLAKGILSMADGYVGMRSAEELSACIGADLFDTIVCVYDPRRPKESATSLTFDPVILSDYIVSNHGTLEDLDRRVDKLLAKLNLS